MKYNFISVHREPFKLGRMSKLRNVSRSKYYALQTLEKSTKPLKQRTED